MFFSNAIHEVNNELTKVYKIKVEVVPCTDMYDTYLQYFAKVITLSEAAENIHGLLVDTKIVALQ